VIARVWSARATAASAPAYVEHLKMRVLPELHGIAGFAGASLLQRAAGDGVEIVVITRWQSLDAVRGFAGDDFEAAVVADEAAVVLTDYDRRVRHYEVVVDEPAAVS
jgi:heme-degrading monooxygenase HmoA